MKKRYIGKSGLPFSIYFLYTWNIFSSERNISFFNTCTLLDSDSFKYKILDFMHVVNQKQFQYVKNNFNMSEYLFANNCQPLSWNITNHVMEQQLLDSFITFPCVYHTMFYPWVAHKQPIATTIPQVFII